MAVLCHFHGNIQHLGTHILRIQCAHCSEYQIVYTCDNCTATIRNYKHPDNLRFTVRCATCNKEMPAHERWTILGKA